MVTTLDSRLETLATGVTEPLVRLLAYSVATMLPPPAFGSGACSFRNFQLGVAARLSGFQTGQK